MRNIVLKNGLIAGLIAGLNCALAAIFIKNSVPQAVGMTWGYLIMLLAFSVIFIGIRSERSQNTEGKITFWRAFFIGIGISFIASLIYALCWELALAITGLDFGKEYAEAMLKEAQEKGASAAELAKIKAEAGKFAALYAKPWFRFPITMTEIFPVGIFVSLISAALLRNPNFMRVK